ncbi:MAG TPA: fibronectin type III domain-containing protein [Blastocatellia bacterium]|nr:fibronectin type III domain-containing protein [Blastocatellia bacterium]
MAKVKPDFKRLPVADKVIRGQQIVGSLTGNEGFPTPNPPLAQITAAIDGLQTAITGAQVARQTARAKTAEQNDKEAALDQLMTQLAAYIESVSGGDETMIKTAGVGIRSAASASDDLSAPTGLSATAGDHDGEVDLHWNRIARARSYVIERSADPPTDSSWAHVKVVTTSSATVGSLTRGTKYWFRVAAISAGGQSGWSEPATRIAP